MIKHKVLSLQVYLLFFSFGRQQVRIVIAVLQLIGYSNCCTNPFIYCFMNDKFQQQALNMLCCKCALKKLTKKHHHRRSSHTYTERTGMNPMLTSNSVLTTDNKTVMEITPMATPINKSTFL